MNIKRLAKKLIRDNLTPELEEKIVVGYWRFKNRLPMDYEPEIRVLSRFIGKGDTVIDLGVNMGQYSSRMARLVGPSGRVIGFEALPSTYRLAQRIITRTNVDLYNIAVSDTHGSVTLAVSHEEGNGINRGVTRVVRDSHGEDGSSSVSVVSAPLDDTLDNRHKYVAFIKCDIEGHEVPAFRGGMKLLARDRPVLLVETGGTNFRELVAMLAPLGYQPKRLGPRGMLDALEGEMAEVGNVFFIPHSTPS